jgi:hypothetical protein
VELGRKESIHLPGYVALQTNSGHAQVSQHLHVDIKLIVGHLEAGAEGSSNEGLLKHMRRGAAQASQG